MTTKFVMIKAPVIELSECIVCGVCEDVCPSVFRLNDLGYVSVAELSEYPESEVEEAIKNCPADCICRDELKL